MTECNFNVMIIGIGGLYVCFYIVASTLDNILKKLKELERRLGI